MSIRTRGLHATPTAWVALACAAAVALLALAAQSASAFVPCPSGGNTTAEITAWETTWPTPRSDPKGVTMCLGEEGAFGTDKAWLQIVDLGDGANIRLHSQYDPEGPYPDPWGSDTRYLKHTASGWYSFLRSTDPEDFVEWIYQIPTTDRLFSTTNASFFNDSDNGDPTTLPFPHFSLNFQETLGTAYRLARDTDRTNDADYDAPKRFLGIGEVPYDPEAVQDVEVGYFPTHYEDYDFWNSIYVGRYSAVDATVAFTPDYEFGGANRRNYLGVNGNIVYILTTAASYTNAQAEGIMEEIDDDMTVIQLDGGGSAQLYSDYGSMDSSIPLLDREVPDILAIYRAP